MPQLGTADITYTQLAYASHGSPSEPMRQFQFTMLFPNGANVLYTSGGIPLSRGKLGCPAILEKFILEDEGSSVGYVAKWDNVANTIRLYQMSINTTAASGTGAIVVTQALTELTTSSTVASTTLRAIVQGW